MTEPGSARAELAQYIESWAESFSQVLGQMSASAMPCVALAQAPEPAATAGGEDLWIAGACSGGLRGELSLRVAPASALRLAQIFMSQAISAEASAKTTLSPEHRDAVVELLRQVAGMVAGAIKPVWGEVQLRLELSVAAPSWPASATAWLCVGEDPASGAVVELQLSAALVAGMHTDKSEADRSATAPDNGASQSSVAQDSGANLDLLMDVELALTLRFGSRRLLLREVLDLGPGSVLELDRQIEEPVDVLLDGRVVARGEVVLLQGNYALRVTEMAPAEN
jgi:flagellar motor switch protein FliN